jgi:isoquinoline 1-oxidoreductase alpha subunit
MVQFTINRRTASSDAPNATPLLWVIREELKLSGTKFWCGAGMCGACAYACARSLKAN